MKMRKDRNSFFAESSNSYQNYNTMGMMPQYQMGANNSMMYSGNIPYNNDINERLAKIERQLNRLDHRLSKLETNTISNSELESNTNNMYML